MSLPLRAPAPIWWTHPNALRCRHGHPLGAARRDRGEIGFLGGAAHLTVRCRTCRPHTFAFGVLVWDPAPCVTFYAVDDEDSFTALLAMPPGADTLTILELLGYYAPKGAA